MSAVRAGGGAQKYPVDMCYMVADLKYNFRDGVKICEIQQASLSLFKGDSYRDLPEEASIHKELQRVLSTYNPNGWIVDEAMADKQLVATLAGSPSWRNPKDLIGLFSDQQFRDWSKQAPKDIHDIASYAGILYISWSLLSVIDDFEDRLPGVVVMDKSSFPLWIDKYRMTKLFQDDVRLAAYKPKWGNYKKVYTASLAAAIARDLGCETFVIKPRGNFMGKGVIIVQQPDLDAVLRFIITHKGPLAKSDNPAYTAWKDDSFDSFVVEQFIASDTITIPHLQNKSYQPTMRVAFLLTYNNQRHDVHFLGEYWKTPCLSLDEPGDFMDKNKDICEPPFYHAVDAETSRIVREQLRIALPILHSKMLQFRPDPQEALYAPVRSDGPTMVVEEKQ